MVRQEYSPPLELGVAHYVHILNCGGVNTYESCQGRRKFPISRKGGIKKVSFLEPTVLFHGEISDLVAAFSISMHYGLSVSDLRRSYLIMDDEPTGPYNLVTLTNSLSDQNARKYVENLRQEGIEVFRSSLGGQKNKSPIVSKRLRKHAYADPTVRFGGDFLELFRAFRVGMTSNLPILAIERIWTIIDNEPVGPFNQMRFWKKCGVV